MILTYEKAKAKVYQYLQDNIEELQEENPYFKEYEIDWWEEKTVEFERGWILKYYLGEPLPGTVIPDKPIHITGGKKLIIDKYTLQCIEILDRAASESLIRDYMTTYDKGFEAFKELVWFGETAKILPVDFDN